MNFQNRQHLLGLLAIAVVAYLASDWLLFTPLFQSWKARSARIAALKESFNKGELLLKGEKSIRTRWDAMRTNTLLGEASVAQRQLLKASDRWSEDSRLNTNIKPQWKQNPEEFLTLELHVDATGNLSALTRFLYDIEKDPLALKLDSVEITARDDAGEQLTLALQVSALLLSSTTSSQ